MRLAFNIITVLLLLIVNVYSAAPPPPSAVPRHDFKSPLTTLMGAFNIEPVTHVKDQPNWASLWSVSDSDYDFGVFFWPPKHCHAIYICLIPQQQYLKGGAPFLENFDCETEYIKVYPQINVIKYKTGGKPEASGFHQHYALHFRQKSAGYTLSIQKKIENYFYDWRKMIADKNQMEVTDWSFENKHLLILTNSRHCEVSVPSANGQFYPVFTSHTYSTGDPNVAQKPSVVLTDWKENGQAKVATFGLPSLPRGPKTLDAFAFLKKLKYTQDGMGTAELKCTTFDKGGITGSEKPIFDSLPHISVGTFHFDRNTGSTSSDFNWRVEFAIGECQWIRFFAIASGKNFKMSDYATTTEDIAKSSLDFFLNEGFYIPPESNEAQMLPDARQIDALKMTVVAKNLNSPESGEMVELQFGTYDSTYLFHQHVMWKDFAHGSVDLHVIKSPKCMADIIVSSPFNEQQVAEPENFRVVKSCSFGRMVAA